MELKRFRKEWSKDQKELRELFTARVDLQAARDMFLRQHQFLHSSIVSKTELWSYADEIFSDVTEREYRKIPPGKDHSLLWILWHITRIEDVTMRVLVEDMDQEYLSGGWIEKLASPFHHTGNGAPPADIPSLSQAIDPQRLLDYRNVVGRNTRTMAKSVGWDKLMMKVLPEQLDRLVKEEAVLPEAEGLLDYWGKRVVYELLLMPPTRHLMVHLNEAWSIKKKIR